MVEGDELSALEETDGQAPVGSNYPCELGQQSIDLIRVGVDQRVPGEDAAKAAASPQLEGYKARDVEVLLLTDPVDSFWVRTALGFEGKPQAHRLSRELPGEDDHKKEGERQLREAGDGCPV